MTGQSAGDSAYKKVEGLDKIQPLSFTVTHVIAGCCCRAVWCRCSRVDDCCSRDFDHYCCYCCCIGRWSSGLTAAADARVPGTRCSLPCARSGSAGKPVQFQQECSVPFL